MDHPTPLAARATLPLQLRVKQRCRTVNRYEAGIEADLWRAQFIQPLAGFLLPLTFGVGFRGQFDTFSIVRRGPFGVAHLLERCGTAEPCQRPTGIDIYRAIEGSNGFAVMPDSSQLIASLHIQRGHHHSIEAHGTVHIDGRKFALTDGLMGHCPAEMRLHQIGVASYGFVEIAYRKLVFTFGVIGQAPFQIQPGNIGIDAERGVEIGDGAVILAANPEPDASVGERIEVCGI